MKLLELTAGQLEMLKLKHIMKIWMLKFAAKIDDELKKVGYKVDPITARYIKNILSVRIKGKNILPERIKDKLSREI
jgi:hypothetical protein